MLKVREVAFVNKKRNHLEVNFCLANYSDQLTDFVWPILNLTTIAARVQYHAPLLLTMQEENSNQRDLYFG